MIETELFLTWKNTQNHDGVLKVIPTAKHPGQLSTLHCRRRTWAWNKARRGLCSWAETHTHIYIPSNPFLEEAHFPVHEKLIFPTRRQEQRIAICHHLSNIVDFEAMPQMVHIDILFWLPRSTDRKIHLNCD